MIILKQEQIGGHTTFRMGGRAETWYEPESIDELRSLLTEDAGRAEHLVGGGSNLLVNDQHDFPEIVCLKSFNKEIRQLSQGKFYVGASVRLQTLIKTVNAAGYGGIEYLYSVPGLFGGAVYMNAGRGKQCNKSISDYIISVDVLSEEKIVTLPKEKCYFSYRSSVFQTMRHSVIVGAVMEFPDTSSQEAEALIRERMEFCKNTQDLSAPNYGTVFCEADGQIMKLVRKIHPGYKGGCRYSAKTANWMLNEGAGTFRQASGLINLVRFLHKVLGKSCRTEIVIWR